MENDPFPPIETERLRLRCQAERDASAVAAAMTPEIGKWLAAWPTPFTPDMALARIRTARERAHAGDALPLVVTGKADDDFMGWLSIYRDPQYRGLGVAGFWLAERYQGQSYMREALMTALSAAFVRLKLNAIEALVQPENTASIRLLAACGLELTGERKHHAPARNRQELCLVYRANRPDRDDPAHIYNWMRLSRRITTSGQPTEAEMAQIATLGVWYVVNLGLHSHEKALPDEAAAVRAAGMRYIHIPVDFENPTEHDFQSFRATLESFGDVPVHFHCIANFRVSAFFYRYRRDVLGMDEAAARADMNKIWKPEGVWAEFIANKQPGRD